MAGPGRRSAIFLEFLYEHLNIDGPWRNSSAGETEHNDKNPVFDKTSVG